METSEKFCLRWNDFESNISVAFREIREEKDFFDCTISVGDRQLQAHKLILSACSPFFRSVLKKNPHQHPLLYLKDVEFSDLQAVLNFMYHGEVNVAQDELNSFLAVAEDLKIKGLTQNNSSADKSSDMKSTNRPSDAPKGSSSSPNAVPIDPPALRRPRPPSPQYPTAPQEDDDIQEVMPVVKTEHIVIEQQPPVPTFQQSAVEQTTSFSGNEGQVVDGTLTHMEDQTGYGDDDGYEYGGYEDSSFDGMEGATMGDTSTGGQVDYSLYLVTTPTGGADCGHCGQTFTHTTNARRHVRTAHMGSPQNCQFCGKWLKNERTYKLHVKAHHPSVII